MFRRKSIIYSILFVLGTACQPGTTNSDSVAKKYLEIYGFPNVYEKSLNDINFLLITSDQHHWMAMGYNI